MTPRPTRCRLMETTPNAGTNAIPRWRQKITFSRRTRRGERERRTTNLILLERRLCLPQAFDGGAAFLRFESARARARGRLGRPARNGRHRGALDQVHETLARVLAGGRPGAVAGGGRPEDAGAGGAAARGGCEFPAAAAGERRRRE